MYCTVGDILQIPMLQNQVSLDEELILKYIAEAELIINGMCKSKGFASVVPFVVVPDEIRMVAIKMTVGLMLKELKSLVNVDDSNMYAIQEYYKDAWNLLKAFTDGKMYITDPTDVASFPGSANFKAGIDYTSEDYDRPWEL